VEPVAHK
jgi:hypothetical protein